MLDTFLGLPLHPLVVHAAVVLLPLTALGLIALAVRPAWRARFAMPLLGLLVVGAGSALIAKLSGERLAERVGLPVEHERLGNWLLIASLVFLVAGGAWLWWVRRDTQREGRKDIVGWAVAALSVLILALTGLVGHSGATAAWSDAVAPAAPAVPAAPAEPAPTTAAPSATTTHEAPIEPAGLTSADLAEHDDATSCWAAINGSVYDLTEWIAQHPGGPERIVALCGTDATTAFSNQHSGNPLPTSTLERYLLGPLQD